MLISVRRFSCLGMNLLEESHLASRQEMNVVLVRWPEKNCVKFFLEMSNLHYCLGLTAVKHLPHQH